MDAVFRFEKLDRALGAKTFFPFSKKIRLLRSVLVILFSLRATQRETHTENFSASRVHVTLEIRKKSVRLLQIKIFGFLDWNIRLRDCR